MSDQSADRVREFEWLIGFAVVAVQVDRDGNLGVLWLQKDGQPVRVQVARSDGGLDRRAVYSTFMNHFECDERDPDEIAAANEFCREVLAALQNDGSPEGS